MEVVMSHMTNAGQDELYFGVTVFTHFLSDPQGREKLCDPAMVDQMITWVLRCFSEVRNMGSHLELAGTYVVVGQAD